MSLDLHATHGLFLSAEMFAPALTALAADRRHVDRTIADPREQLVDALADLGLDAHFNEDGHLVDVSFLTDDDVEQGRAIELLAPYLRDAGALDVVDEQGRAWRWQISDGQVTTIHGALTFCPSLPGRTARLIDVAADHPDAAELTRTCARQLADALAADGQRHTVRVCDADGGVLEHYTSAEQRPRVLLVIADKVAAAFLADNLAADGYEPHTATADQARDGRDQYAAAIIDLDTATAGEATLASDLARQNADRLLSARPTIVLTRHGALPRRAALPATCTPIGKPFSYVEIRTRLDAIAAARSARAA